MDKRIARKVFGTIETHVLQKVGQATLLRFFLNGTHFLSDVEERPLLGQGIVADIICKSVTEFAYSHSRICRNLNYLLRLDSQSASR